MIDFLTLGAILNNIGETIVFLRQRGILATHYMCCGVMCSEVKSHSSDGFEFRCRACKSRYSARTGSFFYSSKLSLKKIVSVIFFFTKGIPSGKAADMMAKTLSRKSIEQWYLFLREVCSHALIQNPFRLGGVNVVELDETCVGHLRKFNRGYQRGFHAWVFGLLDIGTKKCHLQIVDRRDRNTLFPIIQHHILPGSTIHSDEAAVYATLNQAGYIHHTVCHEDNFVNPDDGTHTNNIENLWANLKTKLRNGRGVREEHLPAHIDEFVWRWNHKGDDCLFDSFLNDLAVLYPVNEP